MVVEVTVLSPNAEEPYFRARVAAPNEDALAFYRRAGFTVEPATETLREGSDIPVHPIELPLVGQAEAP